MRRRYCNTLDEETVRRLRKARAEGMTFPELVVRFGFNKTTLAKVLKEAPRG